MTVGEAGRIGGEKRRDEGCDYAGMGEKGGATTSKRYGPEFYSEIGRKGGAAVLKERGTEFFSKIGKKGGNRVRELIEKGRADEQKPGSS